jgi:ATP-binding cassette subfamily D (ALD) long-chain fatty acid import protein
MEGSSETWYAVPRNPSCIRLRHPQVSADGKGFLKGIGLWFALAVPSTYTNTMVCLVIYPATASLADVLSQLRHLQSKLSLRARTRISRYTHDLYLSSHPNLRYYRLGLDGVVQYLTSDINSFCDALSGL